MSAPSSPLPDSSTIAKPRRLLIVCPSWLGDVVMATPALRLIRESLPGAFIGGLVRPGLDELLAGTCFFDELHVDRARGVMGPKVVAAKLRPRRYDAALLLTNSFSTALITRLAFIPRRVGYERDGRGLLLTDKLQAPRRVRPHRGWAPIPAVEYYFRAARVLLGNIDESDGSPSAARLELGVTDEQDRAAVELLTRAGFSCCANRGAERFALLNPGGNNPAKRWPVERFGEVGAHLARQHGLHIFINGSPGEREVTQRVAEGVRAGLTNGAASALRPTPSSAGSIPTSSGLPLVAELSTLGVTIGSLKGVVKRASIMVTNDTGPRHIAAAFGVPTVALFGPTDPRWTTLSDSSSQAGARERVLVADPTLPFEEVADDHPERCSIVRIDARDVLRAADELFSNRLQ